MGTERIMPRGPRTHPQKTNEPRHDEPTDFLRDLQLSHLTFRTLVEVIADLEEKALVQILR